MPYASIGTWPMAEPIQTMARDDMYMVAMDHKELRLMFFVHTFNMIGELRE